MFGILTSLHNLGPILQLIASGTLWISAAYPLIHRIHSWVPALNNSCYSQPSLLSRLRTVSLCLSGVVSPLLSHGRSASPLAVAAISRSLFFSSISICITRVPFIYITPRLYIPSLLLPSFSSSSHPAHIHPCSFRFPVLVYFPSTDIPRRY